MMKIILLLIIIIYIILFYGKNFVVDIVVLLVGITSLYKDVNRKYTQSNDIVTNIVNNKINDTTYNNEINEINETNKTNNKTNNINKDIINNTTLSNNIDIMSDSINTNYKTPISKDPRKIMRINDISKGDSKIEESYLLNTDEDYNKTITNEGKVKSVMLVPSVNSCKVKNLELSNISDVNYTQPNVETVIDNILNNKSTITGDQRLAERAKFQGKKDMQSRYYRQQMRKNTNAKMFEEELTHYNGNQEWWENELNDFID